ncbi:MAG: ribosome small subunit-dependent GTPase A [Planctomycetota bacterium]
MKLEDLGWDGVFMAHFERFHEEGLAPGRIAREERDLYGVYWQGGEVMAEVSGKMRHDAGSRSDLPAVGDWVAMHVRPGEGRGTIHAVLPRKSSFSRKEAGVHTEEQIAAANIDTVFLVTGLDRDFNLRRIERYLTLVWDCGASPVIVLNKADLCADVAARVEQVEAIAFGVPIHAVSAVTGGGVEALRLRLSRGKTAALLGSSGVGKSTLINALLGAERQAVRDVRASDGRGRHTTTRRELILLPGGGALIDNPGMRELQMWTDEDGLSGTFADVEEIAAQCRFRNCKHQSEPGCAVRQAIAAGALDAGRLRGYQKLQRELRHLERKQSEKARLAEKAKWKKIAQQARKTNKYGTEARY